MAGSGKLSKQLGLFDVFAIAVGATLSGGMFLLPGPAAAQAGPSILLCYLLVAIPLLPAVMCIVELSTAMPRAGGIYFFLDRSLGPMAGTIGGVGTWLALVLKTAFALVGLGAYLALYVDHSPWLVKALAVGFAVFFGWLNVLGSEKAGGFQRILLICLLTILAAFLAVGLPQVDFSRLRGAFQADPDVVLATTGLVYISYIAVTKVASIAEEVRNPERNLTRGVFLGLLVCYIVYFLAVTVMVGVLPMEELAGSVTPMGLAAKAVLGGPGMAAIAAAAAFAFFSVSNAGILAASRYPLAMGRDALLPVWFTKSNDRGAPTHSVLVTVGTVILIIVLLDPLSIAKLASTFMLLMFAVLCLAVIVMRESGLPSYDPGYRTPFYPAIPIFGVLSPFALIAEMGLAPTLFSLGLIGAGIAWYLSYGRARVDRRGALFHVFARLGEQRSEELDLELRTILKEKGLREQDPINELILGASVLDVGGRETFDGLVQHAAHRLWNVTGVGPGRVRAGLHRRHRHGRWTPVLRVWPCRTCACPTWGGPEMVRALPGAPYITAGTFLARPPSPKVHAVCFLVSPEPVSTCACWPTWPPRSTNRSMQTWLAAGTEVELREVFQAMNATFRSN
ncbi:MAG: amino acid permease [Planctomycetota bacterium]